MISGGRPSGAVSMTAPMARKGSATRPIGLLDSDASPVKVLSKRWPEQTGQQAHRRTGVTQIDRAWRWLETVQPYPIDSHSTVVRTFDDHTHVSKGLQGCQRILTLEKTLDFSGAFCQRAEHDRAMRDRFVAGYPDAAANAASRVCHKDQITAAHLFHIGPSCEDLAKMLPGNPGPGEYAEQLMPVPRIHRVAQGVEVTAEGIQGAQHRLAIGEKDVVPHGRIASGNPCEIAKTTGCVPEYLQVFVALGQ